MEREKQELCGQDRCHSGLRVCSCTHLPTFSDPLCLGGAR